MVLPATVRRRAPDQGARCFLERRRGARRLTTFRARYGALYSREEGPAGHGIDRVAAVVGGVACRRSRRVGGARSSAGAERALVSAQPCEPCARRGRPAVEDPDPAVPA